MKTSATQFESHQPTKKNVHRFRTMVAHNKQHLLEPIMGVQLHQTGLGHKRHLVRDMFESAVSLARDRKQKGQGGEVLETLYGCDDGEIYRRLRAMVYPDEAKEGAKVEEKVYNVGVMSNEQLVTRAGKVPIAILIFCCSVIDCLFCFVRFILLLTSSA
jgi:hypothetical protein